MKVKIEIKNRFTGSIIFSYEKENNTVKETVIKAVKDGANLYGANLYGANLYGANLDGANLYGANLYGANLDGANLTRANLDGANLTRANLYGANLYGANLTRANLDGANLTRANLYGANLDGANLDGANLPIHAKWTVSMKKNETGELIIKIGCKEKTIKEWDKWFKSDEEFSTKRGTVEFSRIHGLYNANKAYIKSVGIDNLFPKTIES